MLVQGQVTSKDGEWRRGMERGMGSAVDPSISAWSPIAAMGEEVGKPGGAGDGGGGEDLPARCCVVRDAGLQLFGRSRDRPASAH